MIEQMKLHLFRELAEWLCEVHVRELFDQGGPVGDANPVFTECLFLWSRASNEYQVPIRQVEQLELVPLLELVGSQCCSGVGIDGYQPPLVGHVQFVLRKLDVQL